MKKEIDREKAIEGDIEVVVVDTQAVVRNGVRSIIENSENFTVESAMETPQEVLEYCKVNQPELIIVDCFLMERGVNFIRDVKKISPTTNVLVLTLTEDPIDIRIALYEGATGYVLKTASEAVLLDAVRQTGRGNAYLPKSMLSNLVDAVNMAQSKGNGFGLTKRELDILRHISMGMTNKEIARQLKISVRTIETHRFNIRAKTSASSNSKLIQVARHLGLVGGSEVSGEDDCCQNGSYFD